MPASARVAGLVIQDTSAICTNWQRQRVKENTPSMRDSEGTHCQTWREHFLLFVCVKVGTCVSALENGSYHRRLKTKAAILWPAARTGVRMLCMRTV